MCFQFLCLKIMLIVVWCTLNWSAIFCCDMVSPRRRISLISSSVNFERKWSTPLRFLCGWVFIPWFFPFALRPFKKQSCWFSALVPSHRWSGLQQGGLSQVWQTSIPSGIMPLWIRYEILWPAAVSPLTPNRGLSDHPGQRFDGCGSGGGLLCT